MSVFNIPLESKVRNAEAARSFCDDFLYSQGPKYVLGRNVYTDSLIDSGVRLDAIVDDFTLEQTYRSLPVVRASDIPLDAMVLIASGVRPLTARRKLRNAGYRTLDFFSFKKHSNLPLIEITNNVSFEEDFNQNRDRYEWVYDLFEDDESRATFRKLVNFRLSHDLDYMEGFVTDVEGQYFEDFLNLQVEGETFIDAGGFDGATSIGFVKRCPQYRAVHICEPQSENHEICKASLAGYDRVHFHRKGLSDKKASVRFSQDGSSSKINDTGEVVVEVDKLDDIVNEPFTFMKMDIEGAELSAIEGAQNSIAEYKPRIAACVYHLPGDFWRIPEKVLSFNGDYRVRLRHYSEAVNESVMFFLRS